MICNEDKRSGKGCQGAPDWIVDAETVTVYDFENDAEAARYPFSEHIKVGIYEDFYLCLAEMDII